MPGKSLSTRLAWLVFLAGVPFSAAAASTSTSTAKSSTTVTTPATKAGDYIANAIGLQHNSDKSKDSSYTSAPASSRASTDRNDGADKIKAAATGSSIKSSTSRSTSKSTSRSSSASPSSSHSSTKASSSSSKAKSESKTSANSTLTSKHPKITNLPATGSGMDYADSCNQALYSWTKSYLKYTFSRCPANTPKANAKANQGAKTVPVGKTTTMYCDGVPRMLPNFTTPATQDVEHCKTVMTVDNPPPKPSCSIQPSDCISLQKSWTQAQNLPSNVHIVTHQYASSVYKDYPRCNTHHNICTNANGETLVNQGCAVYGDGIQLYYWPQTWAGGYCGDKRVAVTMGPTIPGKPNTVKAHGTTFTSPTVYIKYDALYASNACGNPIGPRLSHGFIPVASDEVSTKRPWFYTDIPWEGPSGLVHIARSVGIVPAMTQGWPGINTDYADQVFPLQYPDLNDPVPPAAYYAWRLKGMDCWGQGCPTMVDWQGGPVLSIPRNVHNMVPEWSSCTLPWGGMNDPPEPLLQVATVDEPTAPGVAAVTTAATAQVTQQTATPCITPTPSTPAATAYNPPFKGTALPDNQPSLGNDTPASSTDKNSPSNNNNSPASNNSPSNDSPAPNNYPSNSSPSPNNSPANISPSSNNSPAPNNQPNNQPINGQDQPSPSPSNSPSSNSPSNYVPSNNSPAPSNQPSPSPGTSPRPSGSENTQGSLPNDPSGSNAKPVFEYQPLSTKTASFGANSVAQIVNSGTTMRATLQSVGTGNPIVAVIGTKTLSNDGPPVTFGKQTLQMSAGAIQIVAPAPTVALGYLKGNASANNKPSKQGASVPAAIEQASNPISGANSSMPTVFSTASNSTSSTTSNASTSTSSTTSKSTSPGAKAAPTTSAIQNFASRLSLSWLTSLSFIVVLAYV